MVLADMTRSAPRSCPLPKLHPLAGPTAAAAALLFSSILSPLHAQVAGTLDTGFNPNITGGVFGISVQGNGSITISGGFSSVGGQTRSNVARLEASGAVNNTGAFPSLVLNGTVTGLLEQTDGKFIIGGSFTRVNTIL